VTNREFFVALQSAGTLADALTAVDEYTDVTNEASWVPVGNRENNRGTIEASGDPGRAVIERVTNGIDAVLEAEHVAHGGIPACKSPREAATSWLNVPPNGLSQMSQQERQRLAHRVTLTILPGDTKEARVLEVRDLGTGLTQEEIPRTILSLNESNKMQKHYLAGAYGQGGSATFAASTLTFIASRAAKSNEIAFTVVRFRDLPPEQYKTGHYVYLVAAGKVIATAVDDLEFPVGTLVRHFGYDLSGYDGALGPGSVYGLLNQTLFDPVMPVWLDNQVRKYRRVIKGSRNALNGAVDEGDERQSGPTLSHQMRMLYIPIGEYGRIGVEYWVLEAPTKTNRKPSAAYVNPARPILLTLNGQAQAELPSSLIRKDAELPYLTQRLVCHVDCNSLTPAALRQLFVSNREGARSGNLLQSIRNELINVLIHDDELTRLNDEARNATLKERDESDVMEARKIVAKMLRLHGVDVPEAGMSGAATQQEGAQKGEPRTGQHRKRKPLEPIELHEPPTRIKIVWSEDSEIPFYAEQRRYLRIETDAESSYHSATDPHASRINFIVSDGEVALRASSPLQGGRMRAVFDCLPSAKVDGRGTIRVELSRPGLPALSDEREFVVVNQPLPKPDEKKVTLPQINFVPVAITDEAWTTLEWPEDTNAIASSAIDEQGVHTVYYSTEFPAFKSRFSTFEKRSPDLAKSFEKRYGIWLVVHSLLYKHQQPERANTDNESEEAEEKQAETERSERIRVATLSAMIAAREMQLVEAGINLDSEDTA